MFQSTWFHETPHTVDGCEILHHLGWLKHVKTPKFNGINHLYTTYKLGDFFHINPIFGSPAPGFHPPSRHGGGAHRGLLRRRELRLAFPRAADRGAAEADARVVRAPGACHVGGHLSLWPPGVTMGRKSMAIPGT